MLLTSKGIAIALPPAVSTALQVCANPERERETQTTVACSFAKARAM
jgi:hypothetical protein